MPLGEAALKQIDVFRRVVFEFESELVFGERDPLFYDGLVVHAFQYPTNVEETRVLPFRSKGCRLGFRVTGRMPQDGARGGANSIPILACLAVHVKRENSIPGVSLVLVIDPDGLFGGDRLRHCSNVTQLHWPRFFLASDGFGRLEVNYARIVGRAYATFNPIPSETEVGTWLHEYAAKWLLFLYAVDSMVWGQWDTRPEFLPRYKTAADRRSPPPPEKQFSDWKNSYRQQERRQLVDSKSFPKFFGNFSETRWEGGGGRGRGMGATQRTATQLLKLLKPQTVDTPEGEPVRSTSGVFQNPVVSVLAERFHEFLEAWPEKDRRGVDLGAQMWQQEIDAGNITTENVSEVFAGLERWKISKLWAEKNGKFRSNIASWLMKRSWKDFPESAGEQSRWA